jgi:hypothetical protein
MNLFIQKRNRKVKNITNTDKLLVAGIAKPQSFLDIYRLQMMYVWFSGSSSFQRKDILDIKNKSLKRSSLPLRRITCDYREEFSDQLLFTNKSQFLKEMSNLEKQL